MAKALRLTAERNLVLIGGRACGKTSVGQALAQALQRPFVDLDEVLVAEAGRSIAELVAEEGWPEERVKAVQECIRTHRFRAGLAPETLEAKVLYDADKLDAIGAIGAARSLAFAVIDGQPLYAEPSETFRQTLKIEEGEAYTAYHEFLFKLSKIKGKMNTSTGKALAEARHSYLEGFFEQLRAEVRGER